MKHHTGKDKEKQAKIPRPPNAFILYRQQYHPIIKAANPDFHNNDICKSSGAKDKDEKLIIEQLKFLASSGQKSLQLFVRCTRPKL
jgi:HMG (high mobility group) box